MADDATAREIKGARFTAFTNGHYHAQREAFLDGVDRLFTFCVLIAGAGVIVTALNQTAQYVMATAVTLFGFVQLVFGISSAARKHAALREKYFSIAAMLEAGEITPAQAQSRMLHLAGEESPPFCAVQRLSENWAEGAVYGDDARSPFQVRGMRRWLRHVWHQGDHEFQKRDPKKSNPAP